MTQQLNSQVFAYAKQFADNAFKAQSVAFKGLEQVAELQLRALEKQLQQYRAAIAQLFAEHPDHNLFGSLPGAGDKLAPRLLSEIGQDRARYTDVEGLQCVAGTAPVSFQSGKIGRAHV